MKPTISLLHVSGLLPAQYRNDPASKGIAFASHARTKHSKEPQGAILCKTVITPSLIDQLHHCTTSIINGEDSTYINLSTLSVHCFVRLIHPIDGLNLGGIYLIYKQNAKANTYSFRPKDKPSIPRWAIEPIDIYPGLELELKVTLPSCNVKPGILKVRCVCIDDLQCNISVTDGEDWSFVYDGDLYLPTQDSQGA